MCLKADKIDEGHRAITLKIAGPALDFENSLHSGNLSKCKQSQLTRQSQNSQVTTFSQIVRKRRIIRLLTVNHPTRASELCR